MLNEHCYAIVLCGGSGKRLWPLSRSQSLKQFIKIFGEKTIFQDTIERVKLFVPPERIILVTNKDYCDEIKQQSPEIPVENIFPEPEGKNTALAMGVGAVIIQKRDPEAVIINFPSDHHISAINKFKEAISTAVLTAESGEVIVTIGLKPTYAHTGLGYIQVGKRYKKINETYTYEVERHIEKPEYEMANRYYRTPGFYWNVNMYTYRAKSVLKTFERLAPDLYEGLKKIGNSLQTSEEKKSIIDVYSHAREVMFDRAISEKAHNLILVAGDFVWSDIGDWQAAYDVSPKDKDGNVIIHEGGQGEFISLDSKNSFIHFSDRLIATIGIEDLIIVDTKDALLIAKKERSQDVKTIVNELITKGKNKYV